MIASVGPKRDPEFLTSRRAKIGPEAVGLISYGSRPLAALSL
jgi:hypothetical protein